MVYVQWGYPFDGPYKSPENLEPKPGIYVVWHKKGRNWIVLDVGESENLLQRCRIFDRIERWKRDIEVDGIQYGAHYMPDSSKRNRKAVESVIRNRAKPQDV